MEQFKQILINYNVCQTFAELKSTETIKIHLPSIHTKYICLVSILTHRRENYKINKNKLIFLISFHMIFQQY